MNNDLKDGLSDTEEIIENIERNSAFIHDELRRLFGRLSVQNDKLEEKLNDNVLIIKEILKFLTDIKQTVLMVAIGYFILLIFQKIF